MKQYKLATIDIGGTNTRFALIENDKIIKKIRFATNQFNYSETLDKVINLLKKYQIDSVALCIPGPADYKKGVIIDSPNLSGWHNINIKKYIKNKIAIKKIVFENDANAMALGNHYFYKNNELKNSVSQFFTISTGFGAGLIINNKIFTGANGYAQEIAFLPSSKNKTKKLHLNEYAAEHLISGTGISLRAKNKKLFLSAKEIFKKYKENDICRKIIDEGIDALARTLAMALAFVNPNLVIFGGSVALNNWWYVEKAIELAKKYVDPAHLLNLRIVKDPYGDDSALIGLSYLLKK
ncbi:ROK family protein [Mesomycoplasma neurolyticum]|uniref:ROK family sugar kinase n=1 Tax=Mesomycoplasma neurolyticum TaxID=2120 RepID=A0A449A4X3_9BACT|nr:ROK family protein [Mesomycoplasma neurolyticum]VEU59279.1 ROK family sugar kinase [Mesomycoplasma neurolyticum]